MVSVFPCNSSTVANHSPLLLNAALTKSIYWSPDWWTNSCCTMSSCIRRKPFYRHCMRKTRRQNNDLKKDVNLNLPSCIHRTWVMGRLPSGGWTLAKTLLGPSLGVCWRDTNRPDRMSCDKERGDSFPKGVGPRNNSSDPTGSNEARGRMFVLRARRRDKKELLQIKAMAATKTLIALTNTSSVRQFSWCVWGRTQGRKDNCFNEVETILSRKNNLV